MENLTETKTHAQQVQLKRYQAALAVEWNRFVAEAKNGLFLFDRAYMDYHAGRFTDHSLLFYKGDELLAVLPANEKDDSLHTHGGLTFGGLLLGRRASLVFVVQAFEALRQYAVQNGFRSMVYKAIPYIYHRWPAEEDRYALFRERAELYRRDANCVIDLSQKISYTKGTKSNLSKARKAGLSVQASDNFDLFMQIEEAILQKKYNTRPVHTAAEMRLLAGRFPNNIRLFLVYKGQECLGGTILFIMHAVVHTQYIGITDAGKEMGALDFLTDYLLSEQCAGKHYFSFGISTEQEGRFLNEGLIRNKESFGARTIVNDSYKLTLSPL